MITVPAFIVSVWIIWQIFKLILMNHMEKKNIESKFKNIAAHSIIPYIGIAVISYLISSHFDKSILVFASTAIVLSLVAYFINKNYIINKTLVICMTEIALSFLAIKVGTFFDSLMIKNITCIAYIVILIFSVSKYLPLGENKSSKYLSILISQIVIFVTGAASGSMVYFMILDPVNPNFSLVFIAFLIILAIITPVYISIKFKNVLYGEIESEYINPIPDNDYVDYDDDNEDYMDLSRISDELAFFKLEPQDLNMCRLFEVYQKKLEQMNGLFENCHCDVQYIKLVDHIRCEKQLVAELQNW